VRSETYDYIVVGGGSAGSIVAARLAEAGASVLLLEAGGTDRRPDVVVPAGIVSAYATANWKYAPEPDPSRGGAVDAWPAGRILGGGGSINATVFVRGNRADYDGWAAAGAKGWDYDSVLPTFRDLEHWAGGADAYRGARGRIHVEPHTNAHPANDAFAAAARAAGHPAVADYNGPDQLGVGHVQVNQRRGVRSSASREYLRRGVPGRNSDPHPTIRLHAYAQRLLFRGSRAVGVEYRRRRETVRASARIEVILCCGSLRSPQLLMLSGVGPAEHVRVHGIEVAHELVGVGANLQEHPAVMQRWNATVPTINTIGVRDGLGMVWEYARHRTGGLAATVFHIQVMHRTEHAGQAPDTQIAFANFATIREIDANGAMKVKPSKENGFLVATLFLHPRQRGRIELPSADPDARPVIRHELLGNRDDLRDLLAGMAEARRIMGHDPMAALVDGMFSPERDCRDDASWERFVRENVTYGAHPVGTCRMGEDDAAVVDPRLRVRGIEGLRVIDASIMPSLPSGNTNGPTMMIAERGAGFVLEDAAR
jgi:choline dehydrogenase